MNDIPTEDDETRLIFSMYVEQFEQCTFPSDLEAKVISILSSEREQLLKNAKKEPLGSHLLTDIYTIDADLPLVVTAHLYFETLVNAIIVKAFPKPDGILKFNYSSKITILFSAGHLDDSVYGDLKLLGTLRNKFAHQFDYRLSEFEITKFQFLEDAYKYSSWDFEEGHSYIHPLLFRQAMKMLLFRLTSLHPHIGEIPRYEGYTSTDDDDDIPF
jgi:hypothetical protein